MSSAGRKCGNVISSLRIRVDNTNMLSYIWGLEGLYLLLKRCSFPHHSYGTLLSDTTNIKSEIPKQEGKKERILYLCEYVT